MTSAQCHKPAASQGALHRTGWMAWVQRDVRCGTQACTATECEEFRCLVWIHVQRSLCSLLKRLFESSSLSNCEASSSPKGTKLSV